MKEQFEKEIHGLAQQIKGLHDIAVAVLRLWWTIFAAGLHR